MSSSASSSSGSNPSGNTQMLEQARSFLNRLFDEVARMSEADLPTSQYYQEFLQRVLKVLAAVAGAVWLRNQQGHLQLQYHINADQVGLQSDESRQTHNELLRQVLQHPQPMKLLPHSGTGFTGEGGVAAGNPTDLLILLVPILVEKQPIGLLEVWQDPNRDPEAQPGYLQFMMRMANLASHYLRNQQLRQMIGQQHIWTQLEAFARQIHGSLNPTEVAYHVANEGRRMVECDRVSVAVRHGKKCKIEAISGADVVEKRSKLVQLQRALCDQVIAWNERLIFSGTKDDSLPPKVSEALDEYLAESNAKLLVIAPLKDEREKESKRPPRSAVVMESFEPNLPAEQMVARLDVLTRHATSALYNAVEHKRIPMRFIWMPIARVQEGLGGKARAIGISVGVAVALLLLMFIFMPYPLKMDATGMMLPEERRWLYSPFPAKIVAFMDGVKPGADVHATQPLIQLYDVELETKILQLDGEINGLNGEIDSYNRLYSLAKDESERIRITSERDQKKATQMQKVNVLRALRERVDADETRPGYFRIRAPRDATVLNWDFREQLTNRWVRPSDPLLRLGDKEGDWEIELKIPQKHIGQVLKAFDPNDPDKELDVDLLLRTRPTDVYKGKLRQSKIAGEATPNRDANDQSEPVVIASVRIDGPDIPESARIPKHELVTGAEVAAKVRCGNRAMGYSLFYGMWEWFYETIVFWF